MGDQKRRWACTYIHVSMLPEESGGGGRNVTDNLSENMKWMGETGVDRPETPTSKDLMMHLPCAHGTHTKPLLIYAGIRLCGTTRSEETLATKSAGPYPNQRFAKYLLVYRTESTSRPLLPTCFNLYGQQPTTRGRQRGGSETILPGPTSTTELCWRLPPAGQGPLPAPSLPPVPPHRGEKRRVVT